MPILIICAILMTSFFVNKTYPNGYEIEEIKKEIEADQEKIRIIKILKKDMDEKEWEIKL